MHTFRVLSNFMISHMHTHTCISSDRNQLVKLLERGVCVCTCAHARVSEREREREIEKVRERERERESIGLSRENSKKIHRR